MHSMMASIAPVSVDDRCLVARSGPGLGSRIAPIATIAELFSILATDFRRLSVKPLMIRKAASVLHLDDRRQVKILLSGDQEAFRQFFDDNFARLYRFALPRVKNDVQAAEELVQQGLSKALTNLESYRGEAQLFTWLCTIVRNEIIDWQRKQARMTDHLVLTEDFPSIKAAVESYHAPSCDEPAQRAERAETARLIKVALDRLPPKYGNALEWKYIEGYSAQEIGDRLNLGVDATNSLLARAKRAFIDVFGALTERPAETAH